MKISAGIILLFITSTAFAAKPSCDSSLEYKKYKECLKAELLREHPDLDSKVFDEAPHSNPWIEALSIVSMPHVNPGLVSATPSAKTIQAWESAIEEAYDSAENKANREEFKKILSEKIKNGSNPLSVNEVTKYTTLVSDYNLLKEGLKGKDLPTFEQFKKNPDLYITRSGWEVCAHKKDSKNEQQSSSCEDVNEQLVVCNGNKYVRSNETSDSLKRSVKAIETNLDSRKDDSDLGTLTK